MTDPKPLGVPVGGMLTGDALRTALADGDRIFVRGSWDAGQLNTTYYALRLAGVWIAYPKQPGSSSYTYATPDEGEPLDVLHLAPGDSAIISTEERWSLDFDVSVLIGPKFGLAAQGLLMLHGMIAHPGYGREQTGAGEWVAKADTRLNMVIANMGPKTITIRRGDAIAYVQFFHVARPAVPREVPNTGFDAMRRELFDLGGNQESEGALGYFRKALDVRERVVAAEHRVEVAEARLEEMSKSVDRVRSSTEVVVQFGVFLIASTIFGIVLTVLISLLEKLPKDLATWQYVVFALLGLAYVAGVVGSSAQLVKSIGKKK